MTIELIAMAATFALTVIITLIGLPILRKKKVGQLIREEGPESHKKKSGTPTMGGIFIIIALVIVLGGCSIKYNELIIPTICTALFGIVGLEDDYKKLANKNTDGISPAKKMLGLFLAAAVFVGTEIFFNHMSTDVAVPFWGQPLVFSLILYVAFSIFVLLATTNAVNLTDGLDGLAGGVSVIILTFLTMKAIALGQYPMVIFGASVIGAVLGFLIFNLKPAKLFMGDTGSLALGGAIAIMAIILKLPLYLIIAAIIPVAEAVSVMLQVLVFKMTKGKKRLFKMAPIHHHFELSGFSETAVVIMFWIVTIVASFIAYII